MTSFFASISGSARSLGRLDTVTPAQEDVEPPPPHPNFAAHFSDPLYYDRAEEMAPFGSDEGSDTLWEWIARRDELEPTTTVRWLVENCDVAGALEKPETNGPDVDDFIIGAGFALIYLTGQIDHEGKGLVLDALRRTDSYYGTRGAGGAQPALMIRDLSAFPTGTSPS